MTLYNYLNENEAVIKILARKGLIASKTGFHKSLFEDVQKQQSAGMKPTDSYWFVAEDRKVGINTVIAAVVSMREEL